MLRWLVTVLLSLVMSQVFIVANPRDGALVTVEVEDENDTTVDVLVNSVKPTKSTESFIDKDAEPFIPTKEWKSVKQGQSIPAGLHVRLNLKTGEREAKLMNGDDGSKYRKQDVHVTGGSSRLEHLKKVFEEAIKQTSTTSDADSLKYWKQDGKEGIVNTKKTSFSRDELKEALKKFKASSDDVKIKQKKQTFRSVEQLKQELKDLNWNMKTDLELLNEILERYRNESLSDNERVSILEQLDWLVHQIDNAQHLVDGGGLELVIKDLNHTDSRISLEAASVIGSSVQSNPQVQVAALKAGTMPILIQRLTLSPEAKIQNRFLYALSTLVRHFPYAQQKLVESGGLQTLIMLLSKADDSKTKVKVVTLVTDIITERRLAEDQLRTKESDVLKRKVEQYEQVDLLTQLKEQQFCDKIPSLLSLEEHDSREKVLIAIDVLFSECSGAFEASRDRLQRLKVEYAARAEEEKRADDSDTYFQDFLKRINDILLRIERRKSERDEL